MKSKDKKRNFKLETFNAALALTVKELDVTCKKLNLPESILFSAIKIYKQSLTQISQQSITEKPILIKTVAAAVLFLAMQMHRRYISLNNISEAFGTNKKSVAYTHRILINGLGIKLPPQLNIGNLYYILRKIEEKHVLSDVTNSDAESLIKEAYEKGVNSKDWRDVAAAAVCIAVLKNNEKITLKEIAETAGITPIMLAKRLKELYLKLHLKREF
jgi:transcription initiation factor TFIIIB Brf1 subunit/transcription initiation factor TFIIB